MTQNHLHSHWSDLRDNLAEINTQAVLEDRIVARNSDRSSIGPCGPLIGFSCAIRGPAEELERFI